MSLRRSHTSEHVQQLRMHAHSLAPGVSRLKGCGAHRQKLSHSEYAMDVYSDTER